MYTIYHSYGANKSLLFDPRFEEYGLTAPTLKLEANKFGTLEFTIYPNHPEFTHLNKITSVLEVYKDGTLMFMCRPVSTRRGIKNSVKYSCEDTMARLNDFQLRPFDYTGSLTGFVDMVLNSYNARVSGGFKIYKGDIEVTDNNDYVHYSSEFYMGHWEALKTRLVDTHGGYFIPEYVDTPGSGETRGDIRLNYLREQDLAVASQEVVFGQNLVDLFIDTNSTDTYSVLVPLGAKYDTFDENGDPIQKQLTIESVNDGHDYIESSDAIAIYGRRETSKTWDDVTVAANLLSKGQEWLTTNAVKFAETVQVNAIDLHNANASIAAMGWMQKIKVVSANHGLSTYYISEAITIPLGDPSGSKIQLGAVEKTLTDRINNNVSPAIQTAINISAQELKDVTELNLDEIRGTITDMNETLIKTIGETETSILSQVLAQYVGKSDFGEYQETTSTTITQTKDYVDATAQRLESGTAGVKTYVNEVQTYIRYSVNGLELGALGSNFKTIITNEKISFTEDGNEIAYISNKKLYINESQIRNRILFGVGTTNLFAIVTTDAGMGIKWVGSQAVNEIAGGSASHAAYGSIVWAQEGAG